MNLRRTRAIFQKELLHIIRDPRSLAAALLQPLIMLLIFGWALSLDVDHLQTYVWDQSQSPQSRDLVRDLRGSRYFTVTEINGYSAIEQGIEKRQCQLGVVIPPDFARHLALKKAAQVQLILDGSDSNTASIARGYAESVVALYSQRLQAPIQTTMAPAPARVNAQVRVWYNPDLLSKNFIVPGLIAVIVMIIAANLGSLTIAREWENGTMEQLLSTPARPAEIAFGKLFGHFLVGLVDMFIALLVGIYVFDVPLKGSATLLLVSSSLFLFGSLALGIMVSASFRSQLMAYQMGTFISFLPAFLLSGFIYPLSNMPRVIQFIALFVPARYYMTIARGVFLKGSGLHLLWFEFFLMIAYCVIVCFFAARRLRQKVA